MFSCSLKKAKTRFSPGIDCLMETDLTIAQDKKITFGRDGAELSEAILIRCLWLKVLLIDE
jgi:hypothetical protein